MAHHPIYLLVIIKREDAASLSPQSSFKQKNETLKNYLTRTDKVVLYLIDCASLMAHRQPFGLTLFTKKTFPKIDKARIDKVSVRYHLSFLSDITPIKSDKIYYGPVIPSFPFRLAIKR